MNKEQFLRLSRKLAESAVIESFDKSSAYLENEDSVKHVQLAILEFSQHLIQTPEQEKALFEAFQETLNR